MSTICVKGNRKAGGKLHGGQRVCGIVLNWNGWDDTLRCLQSLVTAGKQPDTLIIVDNGSTDDSVSRLKVWAVEVFGTVVLVSEEEQPLPPGGSSCILLCNRSNLGYAAGNNVAIRLALAIGGFSYLWILNNDTTVAQDALAALLQCAEADPQTAIWGSTILQEQQRRLLEAAGGCRYNPLTTVFSPCLGGADHQQVAGAAPPPLDYISGAAMFLRTEVVTGCGPFNEEYFLYYEEIDLCTRAKRQGYRLGWCRESVVYHQGGASIAGIGYSAREGKSVANFHENLSTLKFTRNFYPHLLPLVIPLRFFGKIVAVARRGEWYLLRPLLKAYLVFGNELLGRGK